jgi:hypothetical protein
MKVLAFNAQGSRVIVCVRAMKIYVAIVEMLGKKESHDEIQFLIKIGGKNSFQLFPFKDFHPRLGI